MTRQTHIPGTERPEHPDLVEAHEAWLDLKAERKAMKNREAIKHAELVELMKAHKVKVHRYRDDTGQLREFKIADEIKVKSRKLPDEEKPTLPKHNGANGGLITDALAKQAADESNNANVEVDGEGNVIVPDKASPKAKRGGKRKAN